MGWIERYDRDYVKVDDGYIKCFGKDGKLRINVIVIDNIKGFVMNFLIVFGEFVLDIGLYFVGLVDDLFRKGNDFGDDKFSNRMGVGEGRVENGDILFGGVFKIDLIGIDIEIVDG